MRTETEVVTEFRQHKQPLFTHVVFTPSEYCFWMSNASAAVPRLPALMLIRSEWERRVVLSSLPLCACPPTLSARHPPWEDALAKSLRECYQDLPAGDVANCAWWAKFIGRPEEDGGPSGLYVVADPRSLWPAALRAPPTGAPKPVAAPAFAEAAPAAAVAACGPVMRSGAEAAAPLVRPERPAELSELEPASFALLTIEKTGNAGDVDLPLPCCLVQLPDALPPGFNSQDPAAKISVRWWQPHGGYAAKWTPWFEGSRQSQTDVLRGALAVANVQMWGGLKQPQQAAARALGPDFRIIDSCLTPAWAFNFNPHATSFLWAVIDIIGSSVHMQGMVRGNLRFEVTEFRRSS